MLERVVAVTFWTTLFPLLVTAVVHRYRTSPHDARVVYYTPHNDVGLFPRIFNLAKHANISVNGTCGSSRPEVFCRRPNDKEARKANQCIPTLCDTKRNGIRKAIDGSKDSWISPTLENGLEYEYITITLDMKQVYQVTYVTMKAGLAPLPAAWILERSLDGINFYPWQYFAENDAECRRRFKIPATQGKPHYKTDDQVICLINYSKLYHIENGEIHTSLINGRPGLNFSSDVLRNFTLARYVRFRLQRMYKTEKDLALRKKLFYSIRTISIGGQCVCHGHASKCTPNRITGLPTCECEHNTCGRHCDECCPLYNQMPWTVGTLESAGECELCQCHGHSDVCRYNAQIAEERLSLDRRGRYRGGGECLNCKNHTTGVNCERCENGWYRPEDIRPDDPSPCLPCDCHSQGSTGLCTQDDSQTDKSAGWCECKEGYAGKKCDECAPGWSNFPDCKPCLCDSRGSLKKELCSFPCSCKANVEGDYCDRCRPGFFGLSEDNPEGCTKCYCSGVTDNCEETNSTRYTAELPLEGWLVSDLSKSREISPTGDPDSNILYIGNYELPGVESYYWLAPSLLSGNQISLYGSMALAFNVGWEAMRGDTSGQPTVGPNVILMGNNGLRLGLGEQIFEGRKGNATLSASFTENNWYIIPPEVKDIRTRLRRTEYRGAAISRDQLLAVLSNVTSIMLRAKFHTDQVEGSLLSVKLEPIQDDVNSEQRHLAELCSCPSQYAGSSCESCAFSYFKDTNSTFDAPFQCLACSCNNHSDCDPDTGSCKKCEHNTQGEQCEFCKEGFYGDATIGSPDDCKPCACPLLISSNNFSPTCESLIDEDNTTIPNQYICNECPQGYTGDFCEICDESYYGDPMEIGGSCQPCDCKGGPCNNITGKCLECPNYTDGIHCEKCKPLHYRLANSSGCNPCDCDAQGSEEEQCDYETGMCKCKAEYTGRTCNQCASGYGYLDGVCEKCNCGLGAKSEICDPSSGECECAPGALSPKCDECEPFFYGLSAEGCKGCSCHMSGSETSACDIITGQCHCKQNVTGRVCDQCLVHHWGISFGYGCRPCNCDPLGSVSPACDNESGQCLCKKGVGGLRCDTCLPNHYGFSINGCSKCQECKLLGHVCDPETGRCVCPPYTQGVHCQSCTADAWGYQILKGCTPCNCDSGGSVKSECDFHTGECTCRKGFRGTRCDTCDHGYYNFPFCKACNCDFAGTQSDTCDPETGKCQCDESGACQCKANVIGKKCNVCKNGTFGIQAENPNGCTACFCFGRSASCTQAGLHWSQIRSGRSRSVVIEYEPSSPFKNTLPINVQEICYINLAIPGGGEITLNGADRGLNVTNNLRTIPGDSEDVKIGVSYLFDTPVYWKLPQQFLGDKVLSYGGYLKFRVVTEGGNTLFPPTVLSTYPLVQLQGNGKIVLEHFPLLPDKDGHYEVRFHESLWREKYHPDRKVSRETLMIALQNIQHILIRASDSVDFIKAVLRDVSLDTAAASNGLALAGGVELCECPPEYNSTSCQNPSIGFYRWYDKDVNTATILIQLVGEARPCECNNRSEICDIETGFCQNCDAHTGGPHCERCGEGYYGDPFKGPCLSCPCPKPERNFAVACHVYKGRDPVCKCKEGYTGKYCDRCAYGWFGHPEKNGGFCQPCKCNPFGSVSDECDERTGECNCRAGIEGRDCSICPGRTVLTSKGCSTCEDGCTGILLKDFDNLTRSLEDRVTKIPRTVDPPWESLKAIERKLMEVKKALHEWEESSRNFDNLVENNVPYDLKSRAKDLVQRAHSIENRCMVAKSDAAFIRKETEDLLKKVIKVQEDIEKTVENLNVYSEGRGNAISDSVALMEARKLLEDITKRYFQPQKQQAEQILDYCTGILNKTIHMNERYPEIWAMKDQLKNFHEKLSELEGYIKKATELTEKRLYQTEENHNRIKHLKKKLDQLNMNLEDIEDIQDEADILLYDADSYLKEVDENLKNLTDIKPRLENSTQLLRAREGTLQNLNPLYRNKYVKPAQMHAAQLMKKAMEYKDLLNATKQDVTLALKASKAYQDIVDDLEAAKKAAKEAVESDLMYKIFPSEFDKTILERSEVVKALSTRLMNQGGSQVEKNKDLRRKLEEEKIIVDKIKDTVNLTGIADNKLSGELGDLENNAVREQVQTALDKVNNLEQQLGKANEKVQMIKNDVVNKLKQHMANVTQQKGYHKIEKARKDIEESLKTAHRTKELLDRMNKMFDKPSKVPSIQQLPNALADLKNKIMEARHAAQSIRLSLSSNSTKGCVRSFRVFGLEPTTTTRLVITMTVDPSLSNRIIFFLPSSTTGDFMALELVDEHVRFVWNNGGGPGVVSKNLMEETKKNGAQWWKIVVERIGYTARLWVFTEGSKITNPVPASNASNPNFGRFDVGPNDRIWVGGLPQDYERPAEILSLQQGLPGCLHSIVLDDRPVGLWNYFTDSTNSCSACEKGIDDVVDSSAYSFNGRGYSVLKQAPKSTYNRYQFSVAMKFKTYDDNSILFLAISADKTRYASLILRDGRVVFQIGYGGESQLEMSSTKKYNDGNWTIIEASRNFDRRRIIEKGLLKVGDEMKEAAPPTPPMQSQIPELATADYLVGGFPPGYNFGSLNLRLPKPFLGCLAELFIDKDIYNPLKGRTNGVGSSCAEKVLKVAGFHGKGYLKLEASRLKKDSAFGLALRTLQPNALVLLANGMSHKPSDTKDLENDISNDIETRLLPNDKKRENYYSVSLVNGKIEVRMNAGKGEVTLGSETVCNDGRFHSISITKLGRKVELRVDDEFQSTSTLPPGAIVVKAKDLYLGGVPDSIDASPYASDVTPFVGTIKDLLFSYVLQPFDKPIDFLGVDIGRTGPEKTDNMTIVPSTKSPPQNHLHCYRSRKYALDPRAVKFGDSLNSYIQMNLRRRGPFQKNYSLEFSFRTFHQNGVLFIIPGVNKSGKQKNFLLSSLRNGQLLVIVKAKKKMEITFDKKLNNGSWHNVLITREDKKLTVLINGREPKRLRLPKRVNLSNSIYLGGWPENGISDPFVSKFQGFTGCITNLKINNQTEDLIGEKSVHQGVGQCFPHIEKGSYFSGDAFVAHKNDFKMESLLALELEFRTSEMNGILLSISDFLGQPALSLEINSGKIIFLGVMDGENKFRLIHEFASEFVVCDNKWHRIHVMYDNNELVMRIDQTDVKYELPKGDFLNSVISAPLYIGGLPEHIPGGKPILETRDNFKGCMRNILVGDEEIDFTEINMRHNVLIGSCPANNNH